MPINKADCDNLSRKTQLLLYILSTKHRVMVMKVGVAH